jgi:glycosyltransferase involved in cell wall biosynthesis
MLIIYRYRVPFPNPKAHSIQIAHTIHALARAGAEVWFYPGEYTQPTPELCLAQYGLQPHENLHLRLHPQWTRRARQWQGKLIGLWERHRFGSVRRRRPVFYLRDGEDSFEYAQRLWRVKQRWNARVIIEPHRVHKLELDEYSRPDAPEHERAQVGNRLRRLAEQEGPALRVADALTPISATLAEALRESYGDLPPMHVVPSGAAPAGDDIPLSNRGGIVYAGQLYAWKGVPNLIEAMKHLPGEKLTLVGGNKEQDLAQAREVARAHGVLERITFTGHVSHGEVQGYIAGARCAVIPLGDDLLARRFTSPIKVFEYMAAGTPIVASDLPTTREVLRHEGNALLAPPGNAQALATQIARLMKEDELADRLRGAALADLAKYTWDVRAARIIEVSSQS